MTVTVQAGAYASVRAIEKARRIYGPGAVITGMVSTTTGRSYTYSVEIREDDE